MKKDYKEIIIESAVFILMFSVDKSFTDGKRIRKKICKNLKKSIATQREYYDNNEWLYYVNMGSDLIASAYNKMELEEGRTGKEINPNELITFLINNKGKKLFTSKNLLEDTGMTKKDMEVFKNLYKDSSLSFQTLMFTNRLKEDLSAIKPYSNLSSMEKKKSIDYVKNI